MINLSPKTKFILLDGLNRWVTQCNRDVKELSKEENVPEQDLQFVKENFLMLNKLYKELDEIFEHCVIALTQDEIEKIDLFDILTDYKEV